MGVFSELDADRKYGGSETEPGYVEPFQVGPSAAAEVPEPDDERKQQAEAEAAPAELKKLMAENQPEGSGQPAPAEQSEDEKRKAHEAAEAKRKAEWEAKQAAKKEAEKLQMARVDAMGDDEVMMASMKRVSEDTERLTRRNMKECVSEFVQTKCLEDPAFARMVMRPKKSMVHCLWYINRKAREYIEQEMKDNGEEPRNAPGGIYGGDVPDELCYQWAEDYFRDPNAEEDHRDEEKFVPKPYYGGSSKKSTPKAKKEKAPQKKAPAPQKPQGDGEQLSLLGEAS